MEQAEQIEAVAQDLKDAGCDARTIGRFLYLQETGEAEESFYLLARQRRQLLETIHSEQKMLDNLDYLVYKLKKLCKSNH